jgi:hypothetical protein
MADYTITSEEAVPSETIGTRPNGKAPITDTTAKGSEMSARRVSAPPQATNLFDLYSPDDRSKVQRFVENTPGILALLSEASSELRQRFGTTARLYLEVIENPETNDAAQLYAEIETPFDTRTSVKILYDFKAKWLSQKPLELSKDVVFSLRYP